MDRADIRLTDPLPAVIGADQANRIQGPDQIGEHPAVILLLGIVENFTDTPAFIDRNPGHNTGVIVIALHKTHQFPRRCLHRVVIELISARKLPQTTSPSRSAQ